MKLERKTKAYALKNAIAYGGTVISEMDNVFSLILSGNGKKKLV